MNELLISEWTDDDIPQILELARATLGTGGAVTKTAEFWRWKHVDNPFGRSYGMLARDAGVQRVAAMRILLRWQFVSPGGQLLPAARAVDTATHPGYQRRGLFSRLTTQAISDLQSDGTQLIFNTPNDKSLPGYLKMGWTLVDRRPIYIRLLRPDRMLLRRLAPSTRATSVHPEGFAANDSLMPWREFADEHGDQIWELVRTFETRRPSLGWRTLRSKAYYEWRFGQHPHVTYYVHKLCEPAANGKVLAGFAIVRPNVRFGCLEAVLCELVWAGDSEADGDRLLRSLLRSLRVDYVVAHFAPATLEHGCIRSRGFLPAAGTGMRFAVRPLAQHLTSVTQSGDWDLSLADLEIF